MVPGIGFSPDKMLQGRLFSYGDAQRYRLGVMGYEPNSYGEWAEQPDFAEPPLSIEGAADHWNHRQR